MVHGGFDERILDAGCGGGRLLRLLARLGYRRIEGIDPYAPEAPRDGRVAIRRGRLEDETAERDLVLLHSVLEHVEDPVETLTAARRLLAPGGRVLVRIPVVAAAWERYGVHWVQLDAPRHLNVMTPAGLEAAAARAGLSVTARVFDSSEFQFAGSERARRGIPLARADEAPFPPEEIEAWRREADRWNAEGRGDSAAFRLEDASGRAISRGAGGGRRRPSS
jgi:SAM-dependent methyltransferase